MKRIIGLMAAFRLGAFILTSCGSPASGDPSASGSSAVPDSVPAEGEAQIYGGRVAKVNDDGSIEVEQLEGYDYGQQKIVFIVDDAADGPHPATPDKDLRGKANYQAYFYRTYVTRYLNLSNSMGSA